MRWTALQLCIAVLALVIPGIVAAQSPAQSPPPIRQGIDPNGVDLVTGGVILSVTDVTIGQPGSGGLSLIRTYYGGGWRDNTDGTITISGTSYIVSIGAASESFTPNGSAFTPAEGQGSSLTYNSSTSQYTYTSRDGAVATFSRAYAGAGIFYTADAFIETLVSPNGERLIFNYTSAAQCLNEACFPWTTVYRLQSVTNNFGYMIHFDYAYNGSSIPVSDPGFFVRTRAVGLNLAVDYCGGLQSTCSLSISWPSMTYGGTWAVSETSTDALNRTTTYTYDGSLRLTGIRLPSSGSNDIQFAYDANGRVGSVTSFGSTWTYGYSDAGGSRTTTVTDPLSHQRVVVSSLATSLVSSTADGAGRTTSYQYDTLGRLARVTHPEGNYAQLIYDGRGNVTQTTLVSKTAGTPANIVTQASYDASCGNPVKCNKPNYTIDARGGQTDFTYDSTHGGVLTATSPAGSSGMRPQVRTSYTALQAWYKNSSGTLAASGLPIHLPTGISECRTTSSCAGTTDESKAALGYGSTGVANNLLLTSRTVADGTGALSSTTSMAYDAVGNLITIDGPLATSGDTARIRYDALRRVIGRVGPDPDGAGSLIHSATRLSYDARGRRNRGEIGTVSSQSDGDWAAFSVSQAIELEFDTAGRRTRETLLAGSSPQAMRQFSYDAAGRLECAAVRMANLSSPPASACTAGTAGIYGPDRITSYTYTAADQVSTVTTGTGSGQAVIVQTMTYTLNGKPQTVLDGKNNLTTLTYDGMDRPFRTNYPHPTQQNLSSSTDFEERTYDANSNVISARMRNGQVVGFTVDALNLVTLKDLPATTSDDVYFTYDSQGRVRSSRFGSTSGQGIVAEYDALGQLVTYTSFGRTLSYQYNASGNRTRVTHPDGFYATYNYNSASALTSIVDSSGFTLASYSYDNIGRVVGVGRGNSAATGFGYDAAGRLSALTQDLAGSSFDDQIQMTYGPSGQIRTRTQSNDSYSWIGHYNQSVSATANGLNQLTSLGHDSNGNVTSENAVWTYSYDAQNQLRSATSSSSSVTLSYDPFGMLRSVASSPGGTREYLYDGGALVAQYDGSGAVLRRFVHGLGPDSPIAWYEGPGTTDRRWLHADERGSIVVTSDASGTGSAQTGYSSYGEADSSLGSPFKYTGQITVPELGLYYYKSRFYSPQLGRFLQPDPAGYGGGMNLYGYVHADPVNLVDPSGLAPLCFSIKNPLNSIGGSLAPNSVTITHYQDIQVCFNLPDWFYPPGADGTVGGDGGHGPGTGEGQPPGKPHHYRIMRQTMCSADDAFNSVKEKGMSAPAAPAAKEGFTPAIVLFGNGGNNRISQQVDSARRTLVNTTLPGHQFYPGTVTIQVRPVSPHSSDIFISGEGTGETPLWNNIVGYAFFGLVMADSIKSSCANQAGFPTPTGP